MSAVVTVSERGHEARWLPAEAGREGFHILRYLQACEQFLSDFCEQSPLP